MRNSILLSLVAIMGITIYSPAYGRIRLNGHLTSSLYSWQGGDNNTNLDYYLGVYFKFIPIPPKKLYFKTYFRFARFKQTAKWENKMYNGYIDWKADKARFHIRLGRQFTYYGVIRG